jgi:glutaminyl-tRNA synthetase
MPTIAGMRRRGYPPEALVKFCERVGVSKNDGIIDITLFEHTLREDLNARCPRYLGVLDPLKLVITNLDEGEVHEVDAPLSPDDPSAGSRKVALTREVWVERDDFMKEAPKKWHRLAPGKEVRLRYGCLVTVNEVVEDDDGRVVELRCTWDPGSLGGDAPDGRKVRGTIHWVSVQKAVDAEVRLYDRLFSVEDPMDVPEGGDFLDSLNPDSLVLRENAKLEPVLAGLAAGTRVQLERLGYFSFDPDGSAERPVLNRTIALRDSWAKLAKKMR